MAAMAAAVPAQASAHAARMAAMAAPAVNVLEVLDKRPHNMALMAMPAVPVVLLALWAISMWLRPPSICQPRVVALAQAALVAIEVSPLPSTPARIYIWHLVAVAVVPAASAVVPATSEPVAPAVAVVAAVPLVTLPGWFTLEPQMVTIMQEQKAVKAARIVMAHRPPTVHLLS